MYGVEWTGIEKRSNFKLTSENQFLHWNSLVCAEWINFVLLKCTLAQSKQQSPKSEHSSSHLQELDLKRQRARYINRSCQLSINGSIGNKMVHFSPSYYITRNHGRHSTLMYVITTNTLRNPQFTTLEKWKNIAIIVNALCMGGCMISSKGYKMNFYF